MRKFILLAALCCSVPLFSQSTSGPGNPNSLTPVPSCTVYKVYVDVTTGTQYTSSGSPCAWGVQNPTLSYWAPTGLNSASTWAFTQNKEVYTAYDIPAPVTANSVCVRPTTADNTATNNYSFALYNSTGVKVLDTGAVHGTTFASGVAVVCMALSTAATVAPGRYYASFTTNCSASCAVLAPGQIAYLSPLVNSQGAATTAGAANATITPAADSYANVITAGWFELHN